jgi:hypothetical protein
MLPITEDTIAVVIGAGHEGIVESAARVVPVRSSLVCIMLKGLNCFVERVGMGTWINTTIPVIILIARSEGPFVRFLVS